MRRGAYSANSFDMCLINRSKYSCMLLLITALFSYVVRNVNITSGMTCKHVNNATCMNRQHLHIYIHAGVDAGCLIRGGGPT